MMTREDVTMDTISHAAPDKLDQLVERCVRLARMLRFFAIHGEQLQLSEMIELGSMAADIRDHLEQLAECDEALGRMCHSVSDSWASPVEA